MQIANKLILGAVQLGLKYGINNALQKPTTNEALEILDLAKLSGITTLDTANAYGDANQIIGSFNKNSKPFNIINKFSSTISSLNNELANLKVNYFYAYLFHKFSEFENCTKELQSDLLEAKENKLIKNIGVSVYTNNEFEKAINCEWIDLIQIPYNVLDNWNLKGDLILDAKAKGKIIHNRSIFLQGLLFMNESKIPSKLSPLNSLINNVKIICNQNQISINELCLAYSFNNKDIDGVLFGIDSITQLQQNLDCLSKIQNNFNIEKAITQINETIKVSDNLKPLLNPVNWN